MAMSGISQIQMSFVPGEDRILMKMSTVSSEGFQFWLTRRYVKLLWPLLLNMLARDNLVLLQESEEAKKEVMSFLQEEAAQNMDFSQNFEDNFSAMPLGDKPVLLGKAGAKTNKDGAQVLSLHPESGQGIDLALNQQLIHSICKLLQDTVSKSDWDLDLARSLRTEAVQMTQKPAKIN
jgi:hypothetical protein